MRKISLPRNLTHLSKSNPKKSNKYGLTAAEKSSFYSGQILLSTFCKSWVGARGRSVTGGAHWGLPAERGLELVVLAGVGRWWSAHGSETTRASRTPDRAAVDPNCCKVHHHIETLTLPTADSTRPHSWLELICSTVSSNVRHLFEQKRTDDADSSGWNPLIHPSHILHYAVPITRLQYYSAVLFCASLCTTFMQVSITRWIEVQLDAAADIWGAHHSNVFEQNLVQHALRPDKWLENKQRI